MKSKNEDLTEKLAESKFKFESKLQEKEFKIITLKN